MPSKIRIPLAEITEINYDIDGLLVTLPEDSETGKLLIAKKVNKLKY